VRPSALAVAVLSLAACRVEQTLVTPDPHLQRMLVQEKRLPYGEDPALPHGMTMQLPPEGTLAVDAPMDGPLVLEGVSNDRWAERIPIAIDRTQLEGGRRRFDAFCVPCHGERGDGQSVVAEKMALRKPKDLLSAEVRGYPPGKVYKTIRAGYGLMPSYRVQLGVAETWAVVAYVRALQLAGGARAADLPADVRAELAKEAP
jgi:mono/diheme cytochrome c family protein